MQLHFDTEQQLILMDDKNNDVPFQLWHHNSVQIAVLKTTVKYKEIETTINFF